MSALPGLGSGPRFREEATGLRRLAVMPGDRVNVYLLADVLVDAGFRFSGGRILEAIRTLERERARGDADGDPPTAASGVDSPALVRAHALTHPHPDHQGASALLCSRLELPLWCGAGDRAAMASGAVESLYPGGGNALLRLQGRLLGGPPRPVDRPLREGDTVGGFTVLETPGHTPGHLSFWRPDDRVLVAGDVILNGHPFVPGTTGLRTPPDLFTVDPARNRESARRLAALEPEVVCFGHGPVVRDPGAFRRFASTLH